MAEHAYWTHYSGESIKPRFRGNMKYIFLLTDPSKDADLMQRKVEDRAGLIRLLNDVIDRGLNGVVYSGINEEATEIINNYAYSALGIVPMTERDREIRKTIVRKTSLTIA